MLFRTFNLLELRDRGSSQIRVFRTRFFKMLESSKINLSVLRKCKNEKKIETIVVDPKPFFSIGPVPILLIRLTPLKKMIYLPREGENSNPPPSLPEISRNNLYWMIRQLSRIQRTLIHSLNKDKLSMNGAECTERQQCK